MTARWFIVAALFCAMAVTFVAEARPRRSPKPTPSPAIPKGSSEEERLAVANSVRTITDILGVELGSSLDDAHARLDQLSARDRPWKQSKSDERELKIVWYLEKTPFSSIYVKGDEDGRIQQITGFVRDGAEIPFEEIGDVERAPVQSATAVVWDVIRPDRPHMRVAAEGAERRARVVKLFVVHRRSLE